MALLNCSICTDFNSGITSTGTQCISIYVINGSRKGDKQHSTYTYAAIWHPLSLSYGTMAASSKREKSEELWHTNENCGSKYHMSGNVLCPALVNAWVHHCSLRNHESVSVDTNAWRWHQNFAVLRPRNRRRRPTGHIAPQLGSLSLHQDVILHRLQHARTNYNSRGHRLLVIRMSTRTSIVDSHNSTLHAQCQ